MDRITTNLDFVADALQLIASPACACDGAGVVFASNAELRMLVGAAVDGARLLDLFAPHTRAEAATMLSAAMEGQFEGQAVLRAQDAEAAVQVRWDPLESTCRHASLSIL